MLTLNKIQINAVTPLVILGSYWYNETFKRVCFYGDDGRTIEPVSPIMKLIPHCYVLGIKVEQLSRHTRLLRHNPRAIHSSL